MSNTGPLLASMLAQERPPCPGCRKTLESASGAECPLCGEILSLEVVSLRQQRWSDPGALPVLLAMVAPLFEVWKVVLIAVLAWSTARGFAPPVAEFQWFAATWTVAALLMPAIALCVWVWRRRLLRARLWVRLSIAVVSVALSWAIPLLANRLASTWLPQ